MSAELVPLSTHPAAALPAIGTPDVVNAWLRARNPNTLRGYLSDLNTFREWLGATSTAAAVEALLSAGQAGANLMTMNYAAALVERGLAGATIARRLAALRSMCKVSRKIGRTNWSLDVEGPRVEARRDMRGPDLLDVRLLCAHRDWSRRPIPGPGEIEQFSRVYSISGCDVPSYATSIGRTSRPDRGNPACGVGRPAAVWIRGKGRTEKERMTLPDQTAAALVEWIEARGNEPGPLFHRLDGPQAGPGRSTLRGIGPPDRAPVGQGRGLAPGRSPPWLATQRGNIGPRCWPRSPRRPALHPPSIT